uniref:Uncharacterized protein n=1 Tax=Tanacetum cinerariifolium TaxID=118510 RepID=A0A6L2LHK9_TANCI|nr:hypothetical protein [Tanacetum cinerariifolium]
MENSFTLASTEAVENVKIVQSYNGLLLCTGPGWPACNYVYNPSTNLFKMLPPPDYSHVDSPFYTSAALRMDFDPIKSLNYKVVHVGCTSSYIDIQTYWCFTLARTEDIQDGYLKHYKLNIKDHDHLILTTIQILQGLHQVRNFFEPLCNNLRVCITIQIPQMLHVEGKLFESRGCLLVVLRDYIGSREFTIYDMRKWCSVWSVRYLVNTDDFMNLLPEGWSIWSIVWSIVLGEMEEDSCLVINLSGKLQGPIIRAFIIGWSIWSIVWSIVLGEMVEDSCLVINLSGKPLRVTLGRYPWRGLGFESYHGPSGVELNRSVAVLWRKHSLLLDQPLKSANFAYDLRIKYAYHNRLRGC